MSKVIADPLASDKESEAFQGDIFHAASHLQKCLGDFNDAYRKWYSLKNESGTKERTEDYLKRFDKQFKALKDGEDATPMLLEGLDNLKALTELAGAQARVEELGRRMCILYNIVTNRKAEIHELGKSIYNGPDSSSD